MPNARDLGLAALYVSLLVACSEEAPLDAGGPPTVDRVQLTIGTSSVTLDTSSSVELRVAAGINQVQARWLKPDGSLERRVTDADFELRLVENPGRLLFFNTTGAFGGVLRSSLASGEEDSGRFSLFQKSQQRDVFITRPIKFRPR